MSIVYIWIICALFNVLKIMQSFSQEWRDENWGVYIFAVLLAPITTIAMFISNFIFGKWH